MLRWYLIQPSLSLSKGDILLLLDCCFAGQAARGGLRQKFELLAAASMNLMTPGPKRPHKFFTVGLLKTMPVLAKEQDGFLITTLQEEVNKKEVGLKQQVYYTMIFGTSNGSIRLKPLHRTFAPTQAEGQTSFADLELRVSLPSPSVKDIQLLLTWLTANRPPNISCLYIQKIIVKAEEQRKIDQYCLDVARGDNSLVGTVGQASDTLLDIQAQLTCLDKELAVPLKSSSSEGVAYNLDSIQRQGQTLCNMLEDSLSDFDQAHFAKALVNARNYCNGFGDVCQLEAVFDR